VNYLSADCGLYSEIAQRKKGKSEKASATLPPPTFSPFRFLSEF